MPKPVSVGQLLQENTFLSLLPTNRIKCEVTGHELPVSAEQIQAHISAKKFKKSLEWYQHDYSVYLPYITSHKSSDKKLFCTLTKQDLNKIPAEVERHINGKRFKRLKAEFEEKKAKKGSKADKADDEDGDFWVPVDAESEPEAEVEEEVEVDDLSDLVGSDHEEEEATAEVASKAKAKGPKRKAVHVDENFTVLKRAKGGKKR